MLFSITVLTFLLTHYQSDARNVLFLVVDDLRPEIGAYGPDFPASINPMIYTPNIDALAAQSLLLRKAYVQQAICSPSRASFLTGRRPETTGVHALDSYWRDVGGNFTTIPQYFKEHGYASIGMGKIFHRGRAASGNDDPLSWTEPYFHGDMSHWTNHTGYTWTAADDQEVQLYPLADDQVADKAIERLAELAINPEQPFFLALGFIKPHLPFLFPARFLDFYPEDEVALPSNPYAPIGMPEVAWSSFVELRGFSPIAEGDYGYGAINASFIPDEMVKELRRAYYASVSYIDFLIGRVMDSLVDLGLEDDTVVSFIGDHGFQLGEHGEWSKHTNFELSTHAPMMIKIPGLTDSGVVTDQLVEFVDLFPTLADATGLPTIPLCPEDSSNTLVCSEGLSMLPLIEDPMRTWKDAAFSQYPRMSLSGSITTGYSIRTSQYRYTEWPSHPAPAYTPNWDGRSSPELYDHQVDPEENRNRAFFPGYSQIADTLADMLRAGWREAMPPAEP
jgi:iduronate 2-sulfatase